MAQHNSLPYSLNLPFVEDLYESYLRNPTSVPGDWRAYFQGTDGVRPDGTSGSASQERVDRLIRNYRVRGHRIAEVDPLGLRRLTAPELDLENYGFTDQDRDRDFSCSTLCQQGFLTLREIVQRLRATYCRSIGVQFMHIDDPQVREWLQQRMEWNQNHIDLTREEQMRILTRLTDAVVFEQFIRMKFLGAKSFSLEGSESLIPLLDLAIEKAGSDGIQEIVLAMAHRGRLNVLVNILGKRPREVFHEFADNDPQQLQGRGDVKYHLGHSSDWKTLHGRQVHLSLCFNPSHLEFVNAIALGRIRAKQDRAADTDRERGMTLLIHGDASFAGEGIIQETLNLSGLPAYRTGGTLHIIVNNQIGFTTAADQATSSTYCTDVAKMLQIPIFHVNGEDPEAVAQVVRLAMDYRREFKTDAIIDMYCYRRLGHSEADEPSFTQPLLYKAIEQRKPVREAYLDRLIRLGGITQLEADEISHRRQEYFSQELVEAQKTASREPPSSLRGIWSGFAGGRDGDVPDPDTGVDKARLAGLLESQTHVPEGFHIHPKLRAGIERRLEMARGTRQLDWAAAESLAFASLAEENVRIRLTGQDSERGTFSHRHAVLHDVETDQRYVPLQNIAPFQAAVEISNSPLSEAGVLGFEYGYSLDCPDGLVIWEAQYGDFYNAAQVIVDQFIANAEDKWRRLSGVVMLLPHGFEGAGPEHSSARLERFLQLAAEDNIQVTYPTTPAQYFHLLRRQVVRRWRKPLVVMAPKSLLRHPRATSDLSELTQGQFRRILPDQRAHSNQTARILMCSGKIYYELEKAREEKSADGTAILRIEQLYPLPDPQLMGALEMYPPETPVIWVQEEPQNMGAWSYLRARFGERLFQRFPFSVISRPESASPATGSSASHLLEQQQLIADAFR
ncbi:MAG TPA: 2-oxoglutarate dehydrogenase E1 component [Terriglobia bacterium]|nr:2-oxoglutarate dehydrogenase E1 component [Terriglobia bacterium]